MRKLKEGTWQNARRRQKHSCKMTAVFIALFLVCALVFLVTALSFTHGMSNSGVYENYIEFFVNYHIALMVILVIAAAGFGVAVYCCLKENCLTGLENDTER